MSRILVRWTAAAILIFIVQSAMAQVAPDDRIVFADPKLESRSGDIASVVRLEAKTQYQYLESLTVWEHRDVPCQVEAVFRHANQFTYKVQTWTAPDCKSPGSPKHISVDELAGDDFITSLAVCLPFEPIGTSNPKVKGLRGKQLKLARSTLLADAYRPGTTHVPLPGKPGKLDGFARTNCSKWFPPSTCGEDRVATGVRIDQVGGSFTGLRLVCSYVKPKPK
jgi:hypothetical protein